MTTFFFLLYSLFAVLPVPGALAEWLADHPVMLSSVLPLVLQALGNPDLSVSSVSTLKKICRECKPDLAPYASNIVAVSQVNTDLFDSCRCAGSLIYDLSHLLTAVHNVGFADFLFRLLVG